MSTKFGGNGIAQLKINHKMLRDQIRSRQKRNFKRKSFELRKSVEKVIMNHVANSLMRLTTHANINNGINNSNNTQITHNQSNRSAFLHLYSNTKE